MKSLPLRRSVRRSVRRFGLRGWVGCLALLVLSTPVRGQETHPPFEIITAHGWFVVPRVFAPISAWEDVEIEPFATNYFVMRFPAEYVAHRVADYQVLLNHIKQDIIVTVEALTKHRADYYLYNARRGWCEVSRPDPSLHPQSVAYKRCEYRRMKDRIFAVKFRLNGDNTELIDEVAELVVDTVNGWRADAEE